MKWMEMIRLRGGAEEMEGLKPEVMGRLAELCGQVGGVTGILAEHAEYDGDLAVVILRTGDGRPPEKSREGLLLAEFLEEYGFIDHSVWVVVDLANASVRGGW